MISTARALHSSSVPKAQGPAAPMWAYVAQAKIVQAISIALLPCRPPEVLSHVAIEGIIVVAAPHELRLVGDYLREKLGRLT